MKGNISGSCKQINDFIDKEIYSLRRNGTEDQKRVANQFKTGVTFKPSSIVDLKNKINSRLFSNDDLWNRLYFDTDTTLGINKKVIAAFDEKKVLELNRSQLDKLHKANAQEFMKVKIKIRKDKYDDILGGNTHIPSQNMSPIDRDWLKGGFFQKGLALDRITVAFADEKHSKEWQPISIAKGRKEHPDQWPSEQNWKIYPGPMYGIYSINDNSFGDSYNLKFELFPTDFYYFLAAQDEYRLKGEGLRKTLNVQKALPEFSHSISAVGFLAVKDGNDEFAIFAKRKSSEDLGTGQSLMGLPICVTLRRQPTADESEFLREGFLEKGVNEAMVKRVLTPDSKLDNDGNFFVDSLIRGATEELDITLSKGNISIMAYGLDTRRYLYSIISLIEIEKSRGDIKISCSENSIFGKTQHTTIAVEFKPGEIARFLKTLDPAEYCPTTQMAAFYACLARFDASVVADAFDGMIS